MVYKPTYNWGAPSCNHPGPPLSKVVISINLFSDVLWKKTYADGKSIWLQEDLDVAAVRSSDGLKSN